MSAVAEMPRPIRATISIPALRANHALARRHAGRARVWAVVKANAYGHGLEVVARGLADEADGFAVLDFDEAARIREIGLGHPVLMLEGMFEQRDVALLVEHRLTPVIHSHEQIGMLAAAGAIRPLPVYLKVNSGMNRLGFPPESAVSALEALEAMPQVGEVTLMTHFADADGAAGIAEQQRRFEALPVHRYPVSVSNSAALLRFPELRNDWVRPGIMLYGGSPMPGARTAGELGLRPVMTLSTRLISVQSLAAGARVGYGGTFSAETAMRIGIAACGYADGYPRHAPTGTPVLVDGRRTRLLGRVSMDMIAVDLSGLPAAGPGAEVTLWGEGLPADEVATAAGTISYELFCGLARRVPTDIR